MSEKTAPIPEAAVEDDNTHPIGGWLWLVIGLSALMTYRLVAIAGFSDLGDGTPDYWVVAFTGDMFMGITASIVAILLWKTRGIAIWTIAIAWHAIGIKDYLAGSQFLGVDIPDGTPLEALVTIFAVGISFHVICIFLLTRYRHRYLGLLRSVTA